MQINKKNFGASLIEVMISLAIIAGVSIFYLPFVVQEESVRKEFDAKSECKRVAKNFLEKIVNLKKFKLDQLQNQNRVNILKNKFLNSNEDSNQFTSFDSLKLLYNYHESCDYRPSCLDDDFYLKNECVFSEKKYTINNIQFFYNILRKSKWSTEDCPRMTNEKLYPFDGNNDEILVKVKVEGKFNKKKIFCESEEFVKPLEKGPRYAINHNRQIVSSSGRSIESNLVENERIFEKINSNNFWLSGSIHPNHDFILLLKPGGVYAFNNCNRIPRDCDVYGFWQTDPSVKKIAYNFKEDKFYSSTASELKEYYSPECPNGLKNCHSCLEATCSLIPKEGSIEISFLKNLESKFQSISFSPTLDQIFALDKTTASFNDSSVYGSTIYRIANGFADPIWQVPSDWIEIIY